VVQLAGAHSGRRRNRIDLWLLAPVLGNERDGAAHDGVVGGGAAEPVAIVNPIGRKHGGLHHLLLF
jgi:hypothetical protein